MPAIRGGAGLGDSLYVAALCRHLLTHGRGPLEVCTSYPGLFAQLRVRTVEFRKTNIDILAHYSRRKNYPTTQWQDICTEAGESDSVPLHLDWERNPSPLCDELLERAAGRPIVLVQMPRAPMGRTDGFGHELLPDCSKIQHAINALRDRALLVQIGHGRPLFRFQGLDVDLAGRTTQSGLLDVATIAHGVLGYVSYIVPLAEVFGKRGLLVWSRRGLKSSTPYIRQITPAKIIHHKDHLQYAHDDCDIVTLGTAVEHFLRPLARG